jgi:aminoglycoside/choline kinase family phosphotransferase
MATLTDAPGLERAEALLGRHFGGARDSLRLEPLSGDASMRRYFRVACGADSWILVLYPDGAQEAHAAFLAQRAQLESWGLPVPALVDLDRQGSAMLLCDLGDTTLQQRLGLAASDEREALYRQAIAQLLQMQEAGRRSGGRGAGFDAAFDVEKLLLELEFFETHFLGECRNIVLARAERAALAAGFRWLAGEIASWPRVLCHRDYHSRNLMWRDGRLYWIDFQDARLGPTTYDLASLLRDSYVDLPEPFVAARMHEFRKADPSSEEQESFTRRFELTCVQRNLKALGTFGYQSVAHGRHGYLDYVPRTLAHARRNIVRHPELGAVHGVMERHLEEYHA